MVGGAERKWVGVGGAEKEDSKKTMGVFKATT